MREKRGKFSSNNKRLVDGFSAAVPILLRDRAMHCVNPGPATRHTIPRCEDYSRWLDCTPANRGEKVDGDRGTGVGAVETGKGGWVGQSVAQEGERQEKGREEREREEERREGRERERGRAQRGRGFRRFEVGGDG